MDPFDAVRAEFKELLRLRNDHAYFQQTIRELQARNEQRGREIERLEKRLEVEVQAFEEAEKVVKEIIDREKERKAGQRDGPNSSSRW